MAIQLTREIEEIVNAKVQTGQYSSATEVVQEALRLLEERDRVQALHSDELRQKIAEGLESLRLGNSVDGEDVFDCIEAEFDELERRESL